jgi:hypothetical protein
MPRGEGDLFDAGVRPHSPEFRATVRAIFDMTYSGITDEDLLCDPPRAIRFCKDVRRAVRAAGRDLGDHTILRTLTNLRKRGGHAFKKGRGGVPFDLAEELLAAGCRLERAEFGDRLGDVFNGLFRDKTDEDLLCRPVESAAFCRVVRRAVRSPKLPDRVILRTLIALRKGGYARLMAC